MRYTEARLQKLHRRSILRISTRRCRFRTELRRDGKEPSVLPVRVPNLLLNGADGIAVGMATSIPPHNLCEIVDAVKAYMKNNDITVKGLMKYIKGPDFPTGGIVVNQDDLLSIYEKVSERLNPRKSGSGERQKRKAVSCDHRNSVPDDRCEHRKVPERCGGGLWRARKRRKLSTFPTSPRKKEHASCSN